MVTLAGGVCALPATGGRFRR